MLTVFQTRNATLCLIIMTSLTVGTRTGTKNTRVPVTLNYVSRMKVFLLKWVPLMSTMYYLDHFLRFKPPGVRIYSILSSLSVNPYFFTKIYSLFLACVDFPAHSCTIDLCSTNCSHYYFNRKFMSDMLQI